MIHPALVLLAALQIEGTCPATVEVPADLTETIRITGTRQQTQVELLDEQGHPLAQKTLFAPSTCEERAETIAVLITAWTLDLEMLRHQDPGPGKAERRENFERGEVGERGERSERVERAKLVVRPEVARPASSHRWLAIAAGIAVIAGGATLNIAADSDSAVDQPTDFLPALLYLTGATLLGAGIFGG